MNVRIKRAGKGFIIDTDEDFLGLIEDGLVDQANRIFNELGRHHACDLANVQGCRVSVERLEGQYGSLEAARVVDRVPTDCSDELRTLYAELTTLMDGIAQIRFLRTHTDAHSARAEEDAKALLAQAKEAELTAPKDDDGKVIQIKKSRTAAAKPSTGA